MSNSGMYKILASDGKQDEILFAKQKLVERINRIKYVMKHYHGIENPIPYLHEIEKSHIIFFNSTFKAHVPIGTEYHKTSPTAGNPTLGSEVQISIPVFGDFFNDMAAHVKLSEVRATEGLVPAFPAPLGNEDILTTVNSQTSAESDTVSGIYTVYKQEYVDAEGKVVDVGSPIRNFVRYCDLPGIRLLEKTKINVNGNLLDEYSYNAALFKYKTMTEYDKKRAYHRLIGQENEEYGISETVDLAGSSKYPLDLASKLGKSTAPTTTRRKYTYLNGPQTPKAVQPELEMLIPIQFWFCQNPSMAIPSIAIPYGQRNIELQLCDSRHLVHVAPGGLYLRTTVKKLKSEGTDAGTPDAVAVSHVDTWTDYKPVIVHGSVISDDFKLKSIELIIQNIFTIPEIHDIYLQRVSFNLIRVHREQQIAINAHEGSQQLANFKFPVEYFFIGARPRAQADATKPENDAASLWHMHTQVNKYESELSSVVSSEVVVDQATAYNALDGEGLKTFTTYSTSERITLLDKVELLEKFRVTAQSIKLEPETLGNMFFRDYIPYRRGGCHFTSFDDPGVYLFNFALYPGEHQPSGHLNVSRSREFFFDWTLKALDESEIKHSTLYACAIALNFLLIGDGNAIVRYAA